jgi:hypothetical protein
LKTLHTLTAICLLAALSGCVTTPAPADPAVYRPASKVTYPTPY